MVAVIDTDRFFLTRSEDPVKTDLELVCRWCQSTLCDAEDGDDLAVLVSMCREHWCP